MSKHLFNIVPPILFNTWNKLVRYQHHSRFLSTYLSKKLIPKGLSLSFTLELAKDNESLASFCQRKLLSTSLILLEKISLAANEKVIDLRRKLEVEREKNFSVSEIKTLHVAFGGLRNAICLRLV